MSILNETDIAYIKAHVLPMDERYKLTGSLKTFTVDKARIQDLHLKLQGRRFDEGCPACIGDAVKMIANSFRAFQPLEKIAKDIIGTDLSPEAILEANRLKKQLAEEKRQATIKANKAAKEALKK